MKFWALLLMILFLSGCSPVSLSRIGPTLPSRGLGCEVTVLPPGETPIRPHRIVGMIHVKNCQEYTSGLCLNWVKESICELGGNVAFLPDPTPPKNDIDAVNFRISVAVYLAEIAPPTEGVCKEPPLDASLPETEPCAE